MQTVPVLSMEFLTTLLKAGSVEGMQKNIYEEIIIHKDHIWFLLSPPPIKSKFSPLVDFIDWYNNQLLAKSFKRKKITLQAGEKTLLHTSHLLPSQKLIAIGLEDLSSGKKVIELCDEIKKISQEVVGGESKTSASIHNTWIVISEDTPTSLKKDLEEKMREQFKNVTVG